MAQEQTAIVVKGIKQTDKKMPMRHNGNVTTQKGGVVRQQSDNKRNIRTHSSMIRHN